MRQLDAIYNAAQYSLEIQFESTSPEDEYNEYQLSARYRHSLIKSSAYLMKLY